MRFFQHPVDDLLDRLRLSAQVTVGREGIARSRFRWPPAGNGYQRIFFREPGSIAVRSHAALIVYVMCEQKRRLYGGKVKLAQARATFLGSRAGGTKYRRRQHHAGNLIAETRSQSRGGNGAATGADKKY